MARTLDVYLARGLVGHLKQNDDGQMAFDYAASWLKEPGSFAISCSLPLRDARFTQKECGGFFGGLLPEEGNRRVIARNLQISERNDFALLERIGGECAGALTFVPAGRPSPEPDNEYRSLTNEELADILHTLPRRPLLAGEKGVRLSLAGAQDKIAVRLDENGSISLPLNYAPSTHVLKPAIDTSEGVVDNEAFCMHVARAAGIAAAETTTRSVDDISFLLSGRYDRYVDKDGIIRRLHQEDFCQALGMPSARKYESEGGPALNDCFDLLRAASSSPVKDLRNLLDAVIFNLLIGNNDAHAKNFALLYLVDGRRELAPLYDLVCTVCYPEIENRLAMKIGREVNPDLVSRDQFDALAKEAGLGPALVKRRVPELADHVLNTVKGLDRTNATAEKLAAIISNRCTSVIERFKSIKSPLSRFTSTWTKRVC
jgi:serine/threonine-protein kinase HipA